MPFVSEALWQRLPVPAGTEREPSLVVARWPVPVGRWRDETAETQMNELMELISTVRMVRSDYKVPPATRIEARLSKVSAPLQAALASEARALRRLARAEPAANGATEGGGGAHAILRGGTELLIPLEGIIDVDRERGRLRGELERVDGQLQATERKLANEKFVGRAPEAVVAREREKAESFRTQRERLAEKLAALE
jgi:valyl-tRNA synthetase